MAAAMFAALGALFDGRKASPLATSLTPLERVASDCGLSTFVVHEGGKVLITHYFSDFQPVRITTDRIEGTPTMPPAALACILSEVSAPSTMLNRIDATYETGRMDSYDWNRWSATWSYTTHSEELNLTIRDTR